MAPIISFLIPAHNEEHIIGKALENLAPLVAPEIEVLIGLDGCTDGTEQVARRFGFARLFVMEERGGKPAVLAKLEEAAEGEITIIHDADWKFNCDRSGLEKLIADFADPEVGGIILPPYPIPFLTLREGIDCIGYLGAGIGIYLLHQFLLQEQTKAVDGERFVEMDKIVYPFALNVYRSGAAGRASTAADDFERFLSVRSGGYKVKVYDDPHLPYLEVTEKKMPLKNQFRQRIKGHLARRQLKNRTSFDFKPAHLFWGMSRHYITHFPPLRLRDFLSLGAWLSVVAAAYVPAAFKWARGPVSAKEAWKFRVRD